MLELCAAIAYRYSKDNSVRVLTKFICFLILFIPAALRYNTGKDYAPYALVFESNSDYGEIGWQWLNAFVHAANMDVQWIFVISSFLIYILLLKIDKKNFVLQISLYFFLYYSLSYNIVRNAIVFSLFIYCYQLWLSGKEKQSLLILLLGFLFHNSTIAYYPVLLLPLFFNLSKERTLIIYSVLTIFLIKLNPEGVVNQLVSFFPEARYLRFFISGGKNGIKSNTYFGLGTILKLFFLLVSYLCCDERHCSKKEFTAISVSFLFLWASELIFIKIYIFYRVNEIFWMVYMMIARSYLYPSKNMQHLIGKISVILYIFFFVFVSRLISNGDAIVPYTTIFSRY